MPKRVNISTARKDLPSLFDRVTARDGEKVVIRRRDGGREAVLVGRGYVDRLEQQGRRLAAREPFTLLGSLEVRGDADGVVEDVRARDRHGSAKRLAALLPRRRPR